jgi:hypothetical protein
MARYRGKIEKSNEVQLPYLADFGINPDVRFWHKADIATVLNDVRFWG